MFDVTAIGELLIDMAQSGLSDIGSPVFEANPGGAPCNVLAMLNKLGRSTAFIGKVGDDIFGRAKQKIDYGCSVSDIVKIEIDELCFLTGCNEINKAVEIFKTRYQNVALLTVTAGRNGSRAYYKNIYAEAPTFLNVKTIDTTGAGDTFCACCIDWFLNNGSKEIEEAELRNMLVFANAAASLVTCKKGALLSMPEISDINNLIKENENNE